MLTRAREPDGEPAIPVLQSGFRLLAERTNQAMIKTQKLHGEVDRAH